MVKDTRHCYENLYLIGFPKFGSTSLRTYLKKRFKIDNVFTFPGFSLYNPTFDTTYMRDTHINRPNSLYIIITRDPYQRIWSAYWWGVHRWLPTDYKGKVPTFTLRVNVPRLFGLDQLGFIENVLRRNYDLQGCPVRLSLRKG